MNLLLQPALMLTYNQLSTLSGIDNFWNLFDTAFGTQYNHTVAESLRLEWQAGDFSQLPQIEILDSNILGGANGAYAISTNKIYLSANFVATATPENLVSTLLEEIGHFVDAQINLTDSAGDEGAIFAELVQGYSLDTATLQALKTEDDHATITINGQVIQVEQQNFTGTNGNDIITGTSGDDVISPLRGSDTVDGGAGNDLLIVNYSSNTYTGISSGISSYVSSNGNGGFNGSYDAYSDTSFNYDQVSFINIERFQITGTGADDNINTGDGNDTINGGEGNDTIDAGGGDDIINGDAGNDTINAGAGNDTINAGAGDDVITGGAGINVIDGGAGIDTLTDANFSSATAALSIDDSNTAKNITVPDGTSVTNIEKFTGLRTGGGNDVINFSQRSNDTINTGSGNDTINAGLGSDNVDGGAGNDLLIVNYSSNTYTGTSSGISSYVFSNGNGGFNGYYYAYSDTSFNVDRVSFSNIERFQITGTGANDNINTGDGNDIINSDAGNDIINAGAGNDTINAGAGDDLITGGAGINVIDGGAGIDTLTDANFSSATTALSIDDSNTAKNITVPDGTSVTNIEKFTGLTTGSGNDVINYSQRSNDTINTGSGNDTINAGLGSDNVDGGAGNDLLIVDYSSNTYIGTAPQSGISSSVSSNGNNGFNGFYLAFFDTNLNFDQVSFSNIERFQITGTNADDNIKTGDGDDIINSGAGNDTINAGAGNDTIDGVNGTLLTPGLGEIDVLTGGTGNDIFILGNATKVYYDDGNTLTNGSNDYADITDLNVGDIIQLQGTSSNYLLNVVGTNTQILINKPNTEPDELIGIVRNQTGLSLTSSNFAYLGLPIISLTVSPSSVTEDGTTNLVYTFTRTGATTNSLSVNYSIAGTADSTDYSGATPGTGKNIIFAANSATATLTIDPTTDTIVEPDETVALTLVTGTGYNIGTTTAVTGTITNDDLSAYDVIESAGNTKLVKDITNKYFAQTGTATPTAIKTGGQQIYQNIYTGWQTLAAETINGNNQVLWKNIAGNYLNLWKLDSNWNWTSSEGQFALNSAEALTQETNFGIDANGDGIIGNPYTPIESAGNTRLLKDPTNKYYAQVGTTTPIAIKNGGQQIYQDIYAGWQTLAVETVNGQNQVLWKNIAGNYLNLWKLDSNWNWTSSEGQFALNSAEALTQETNFGIDANGDGIIGNPYTPIESAGNTRLLKDPTNKYYAQVGTTTPIAIKNGGQQIYQDIYAGWQTLAVETVNGQNQVLWKNIAGNYLNLWKLDSNWNWTSSEGQFALNSAEALTQETNFGIDANGDGIIGNPYTPIESAGNTRLLKDPTNKYYAQVGTTTPIAIKNGGQQIYQDIYAGWQTLAVETVNGQNQVLWKNIAGNYLNLWKLDSNWNWTSSEGQFALNSAEALTQETNFGIDANGDGIIGNPYTPIESAGNTRLLKDPTNKYYAQVGTTTPIAIKNGGQQIYQDIYAGWQTLAVETVNGQNQVLWKNIAGNYLNLWKLDSNWNWTSSEGQFALNSAEALTQETNFGIDANGDGIIGNPYTPIESAGNTRLLKDPTNKYYAQVGTTTPIAIKNGGQQIYQDIYAGWQTLAVETVNGQNQVLWKNIAGNYLNLWKLDSNWNWTSSEGQFALNSAEALTQETNFGIDANGDGIIGNPYTPIESAGNTRLLKDPTNKYYAQVGTTTPIAIKNGGQQIYQDIYAGWQTLAVETVNGQNQVLWKNIAGNYLNLWKLDSNWNWTSSEGQFALNSPQVLTQEANFQIDLNGDGLINIETAGNSPLSLGVNGYLLNNNTLLKYNGNGVTDKIFDSASEDWNLLGAEKTGTGYQGMWRSSLGSYSLWNTDNLGNYLSSTTGLVAGMVAYETTFAQDFNGNGAIGS